MKVGHWTSGLRHRLQAWALRRSPASRSVTLTQKRIYILPTLAGMLFLLLLFLLLLLAINYQNNLAYAATFLLGGMFVVSILHTYSNLAGLRITAVAGHPCFAGEMAGFTLKLQRPERRVYEQLDFSWQEGPPLMLDMTGDTQVQIELACPVHRRGWCLPGPLRIQTRYPFGLFRAWTWINTDLRALVYPRPMPGGELPPVASGEGEGLEMRHEGSDDFSGLTRFEPGMSPRRVAWKVFARGQGMHASEYIAHHDRKLWLDWDGWPALDVEQRLSRLSYWVVRLAHTNQPYGLRLPGKVYPPATGDAHRQRLLQALALFRLPEKQVEAER